MPTDEKFMRRALDLASLGLGTARSNPLVGCVIVHQNKIIGEGWHQTYGGPHAEVNAVNSVKNPLLLPQSKAYVTLEPCAHYGKTPPCADFLLESGLRDVVICNPDPNPLVAGRGLQKLMDAGCHVHVGVLEQEGYQLNQRFFTFQQKKRPYLVLKWAESADGFVGLPGGQPVQISGPSAKKLVHKWRTEEQAILVGTRTAMADNPQLNARHWPGPAPLRVAIDKNLQIPETHFLRDNIQPTLIYTLLEKPPTAQTQFVKLLPGQDFLDQMLQDLYQRNVQSVLVEGGTFLLESLLQGNLWDEIRIFRSTVSLGDGVKAPYLPALPIFSSTKIGQDELRIYRNA